MDIQANLVYSPTRYDVASYFRSAFMEVREEKRLKMSPLTASGQISGTRYMRESRNFTHLLGTAILTNLPDMTSPPASDRLQNAIQYCTTVRKTGAVGTEAHSSVTV